MALIANKSYSINAAGNVLTIQDDTGDGAGGYGDAGNNDLNDTAIVALCYRQRSDGTVEDFIALVPADKINFDSGASNSKVNTFTFTYLGDGGIVLGIAQIEAWDTGNNYRSGTVPVIGDYYYDTNDGKVKKATAVGPPAGTDVEDLNDLFSASSGYLGKSFTEYLLDVKAQLQRGVEWKSYKNFREQQEGGVAAANAKARQADLFDRISGARYDFDKGNINEARKEMELINTDYSI
jgi:hypothetical protein